MRCSPRGWMAEWPGPALSSCQRRHVPGSYDTAGQTAAISATTTLPPLPLHQHRTDLEIFLGGRLYIYIPTPPPTPCMASRPNIWFGLYIFSISICLENLCYLILCTQDSLTKLQFLYKFKIVVFLSHGEITCWSDFLLSGKNFPLGNRTKLISSFRELWLNKKISVILFFCKEN